MDWALACSACLAAGNSCASGQLDTANIMVPHAEPMQKNYHGIAIYLDWTKAPMGQIY